MTEPAGAQRPAAGTDVALRTWLGWHVVFGVLLIVVAALTVAEDDLSPTARGWTLGLLAAWAVLYAATVLQLRPDEDTDTLGMAYVVAAVPLFTAAFALYPAVALMLFILYPQTWAFIARRWVSIAANVVLSALIAVVSVFALDGSASSAAFQSLVSLVTSIVLGVWITGIVHQSRGRAEMIDELARTRAELATVSHDAGVLAERERLAREIHDTLAQGFTSVLMLLEAAEAQVRQDPDEAVRHLRLAQESARQNLAEARSLVAALTPVDLQAAPLPEAFGRLVDRFGAEVGVTATLRVEGEPRVLPAAAEVVLLRCAQEALSNIRKHAGARAAAVTLRYCPEGGTVLEVTDDGTGFDPAAGGGGYGLAGMRARVEQVGGVFQLGRPPAGGTTVAVRIP